MTSADPMTKGSQNGLSTAPQQTQRLSPEHARRVMERAEDYVTGVFRAAGSSDYIVGLSIGGNRAFIVDGGVLKDDAIPRSLASDVPLRSLLKPLIAVAALELTERGLFDLRDPIGKYVPELSKDKKGELIRVQDLVSHTPGYLAFSDMPREHRFRNRGSALAEIRIAPQIFWPGAVYNYDHSATAMLGEVLESVTGRSVPDLVGELILSPLGCDLLTREYTTSTSSKGGGSSVADDGLPSLFDGALPTTSLLSLVESLMGGEDSSIASCFSPSTLRALRESVVDMPRTPKSAASRLLATGHSLGLHLFRNGFIGYDTNTTSQAGGFRFDPTRQIAVVLVTESRYRAYRATVLSSLIDMIDDTPMSAGSTDENDATQETFRMANIVGDYFGNHAFDVNVCNFNRRVVCTIRRQRGSRSEIHGEMDEHGRVFFKSEFSAMDPSFFRYSRTGETCMMFGMFALKRTKRWREIASRLIRRG